MTWRPPRQLRFTREGKYFVAITLAVGLAAINTGNNLLYLLLGMLLSLILASGIMSELCLRQLTVARLVPRRVHAEQPFLVSLELTNGKRRLPSFSIEIEDLVAGRPIGKKCYFLKLPPGRTQRTSYRHEVAARGRHLYSALRLSTKFPFGLFIKSRLVDAPEELIVCPKLVPVVAPPMSPGGAAADEAKGARGGAGELHGLRDLREGEDPRHIHWRASAKVGRLLFREYEEEAARRITLLVDNAAGTDDPAAIAGVERAIAAAASLCKAYLERRFAVRLVARGEAAPPFRSAAQLGALFETLALLPIVDESAPFPPLGPRRSPPLLVVARGARRTLPARVYEA